MDYETKEDLTQLRIEMLERMEQMETTLLKEFCKWAVPNSARLKVHEVGLNALSERVELIEERLTNLEQK